MKHKIVNISVGIDALNPPTTIVYGLTEQGELYLWIENKAEWEFLGDSPIVDENSGLEQ